MSNLKHQLLTLTTEVWPVLWAAIDPKALATAIDWLDPLHLTTMDPAEVWKIRAYVEAVAANDVSLLAERARSWPKPCQTHSRTLWLTWFWSVRHIYTFGVVQQEDFQIDECGLRREADTLWGKSPHTTTSWTATIELVAQQPCLSYNDIRKLSMSQYTGPYPTVEDLLSAPPELLRLLRGKMHHFDELTKEWIVQIAS